MTTARSFALRDSVVDVDPGLLITAIKADYYTLFPTVALAMLVVYDSGEDSGVMVSDVVLSNLEVSGGLSLYTG